MLGTKVDVCSGSRVDDSVCVLEAIDDSESRVGAGIVSTCVVAAEIVVEASDGMASACHVQIHPVFVGSTEQIMSEVQVRIVFHLSSKHPTAFD